MKGAVKEIHRPVLVSEVIDQLRIRPEGKYIDGTIGAGGHTEEILKKLGEKGRVLGIDRDPEILNVVREKMEVPLYHGSFEDLDQACDLLGTRQVDGILLDLGISSLQVDRPERGFSFMKEASLDMRMDPSDRTTAEEIIRKSSERELERILRDYGEEPFARKIAAAIVERRRRRPIDTTTELAEVISKAIPVWPHRLHPATRTFQALRIAVNRELDRLKIFLERAPAVLASGGRLVILSYHSLEDRIVKQSFVRWEMEGVLRRITKKPIRPSEAEILENPRARSAKMRVAEKME
ncbi:MAG: 16S rRNA (cytosine(1402)-N(4))-methyltransferase RsmH [Candidatus Omnitrophota bacterium]